jgi:predicted nucleic acid-binding Zn ribbon protein
MAGLGAPEIDATTTIVESWSEIVGPELAKGVVAVAVRGKELLVRVDDPAWASQISWLEAQLLDRINNLVGPGRVTSVRATVAR